ncbi:MAG: glycoside hydrolase family 97 N-terminal domain-containing protein [Steroidobacteraceae bacterium]
MLCGLHAHAQTHTLASPSQRLRVAFRRTESGEPRYSIALDRTTVLQESKLGLVRDDADFSRDLRLVDVRPVETVRDEYELATSKRRHNTYVANRRVFVLQTPQGAVLETEFQVSDTGVGFRYVFPQTSAAVHRIRSEASSFNFPVGTKAWLQPVAVAKSGWESSNPSYEELYDKEIAVGTPPHTEPAGCTRPCSEPARPGYWSARPG